MHLFLVEDRDEAAGWCRKNFRSGSIHSAIVAAHNQHRATVLGDFLVRRPGGLLGSARLSSNLPPDVSGRRHSSSQGDCRESSVIRVSSGEMCTPSNQPTARAQMPCNGRRHYTGVQGP